MIQTWLPLPNYHESLRTLRMEELAMVRFHVLEIMEYLHEVQEEASQLPSDYKAVEDYEELVPTANMWNGFELQLCEYGLTACDEWSQRRGKKDPMYDKIEFHLECADTEESDASKPNWFGDVDFHLSHQAALVRLDPNHYSAYFKVDTERELEWPTSKYVK